MAGRPPVPNAVKRAQGTYQPSRDLGEPEVRALSSLPSAPGWISARAKRIWRARGAVLVGLGILTEPDLGAFEHYCDLSGEIQELRLVIRREGRFLRDEKRRAVKPHPAMLRIEKLLSEHRQLSIQFGMTPSGRVRVSAADAPAEQDDPLSEFEDLETGGGGASGAN